MQTMKEPSSTIQFEARLQRPANAGTAEPWTFFRLPQGVSDRLPTRSMQSVDGTFNGTPFQATLEPDGEGGHWLRVKEELRKKVGATAGDVVKLQIAPVKVEPEPEVPADLEEALSASTAKARETWKSITSMARRDWIFWIVSGKKAETRAKRIGVAIDKLSKGNRRPCCFDRSGMYDKSLSCPLAEEE